MNADSELSGLLRSWETPTLVTPGFRRDVWCRIEAVTGDRRTLLSRWIELFALPRVAVTACALALFAGVFAGSLKARSAGEALYLRSVDPLALHARGR